MYVVLTFTILYIVHYALYTILYPIHYTLCYTVNIILESMYCVIYTIDDTLYTTYLCYTILL